MFYPYAIVSLFISVTPENTMFSWSLPFKDKDNKMRQLNPTNQICMCGWKCKQYARIFHMERNTTHDGLHPCVFQTV